jgi:hypothetical protein
VEGPSGVAWLNCWPVPEKNKLALSNWVLGRGKARATVRVLSKAELSIFSGEKFWGFWRF